MERPVSYYFEHALKEKDGQEFLITIMKRVEPHPLEYVKSFFGLLGPVPEIEESVGTYVLEPEGDWTDVDTGEQVTDEILEYILMTTDMMLREGYEEGDDLQLIMHR